MIRQAAYYMLGHAWEMEDKKLGEIAMEGGDNSHAYLVDGSQGAWNLSPTAQSASLSSPSDVCRPVARVPNRACHAEHSEESTVIIAYVH